MRSSAKQNRSGQAIIMVTASLMFMFSVMGLAIDLGWAYYLKTRVQTAADAAAVSAGLYALRNGDSCSTVSCGVAYTCAGVTPPTTSLQAGCLYATQDGPPSMTATLLENNTTPPGVTGNNPALWIKATVSTTAPNLFFFGSGGNFTSISAQAISGVSSGPSGTCVYVLDPTASNALVLSGSSTLVASSCGVYVNSSSSKALVLSGSASITADQIRVVGGSSISSTNQTSTVTTGTSAVADPFASLPAPSYSGCDYTNFSLSGATATLNPGVYCGGINLSGASQLTLNSGIYILKGGGLVMSSSSQLTGSHVMLYNTGAAGYPAAPIKVSGSASLTLSAPDSGTYKGVTFFQDRNKSYSSDNTFSSTTVSNVTGTYYFPTTGFTFSGSTTANAYAAIVAQTVSLSGSSSIKKDTVGTYTGLSSSTATLIQ